MIPCLASHRFIPSHGPALHVPCYIPRRVEDDHPYDLPIIHPPSSCNNTNQPSWPIGPHLILTMSFIQHTSLPPAQICFPMKNPCNLGGQSDPGEDYMYVCTRYPRCSIARLSTPVKTLLARSRTSRDNGYAQHALKPQRRLRFRKFSNKFRGNLARHCTLGSSLWFLVTCIFADCTRYYVQARS